MSAIPLLSEVVPGISVPSEDHRSVTLDNYLPLSALTLLNWTLLNAQFSRPPNGMSGAVTQAHQKMAARSPYTPR
eukprot:scaffold10044_cov39-Phaeocystis_antarctica.AAC.1